MMMTDGGDDSDDDDDDDDDDDEKIAVTSARVTHAAAHTHTHTQQYYCNAQFLYWECSAPIALKLVQRYRQLLQISY